MHCVVYQAMRDFGSDTPMCRATLGVMRNVCGNDTHKTTLVHNGGLTSMLRVMATHKHDTLIQVCA
jgi:hypothetical protein